jgi:hypothetical protein
LLMATHLDEPGLVHVLLEFGADPALEDWWEANALDYARSEGVGYQLIAAMFPERAGRSAAVLKYLNERPSHHATAGPRNGTALGRAIAGSSAPWKLCSVTARLPMAVPAHPRLRPRRTGVARTTD